MLECTCECGEVEDCVSVILTPAGTRFSTHTQPLSLSAPLTLESRSSSTVQGVCQKSIENKTFFWTSIIHLFLHIEGFAKWSNLRSTAPCLTVMAMKCLEAVCLSLGSPASGRCHYLAGGWPRLTTIWQVWHLMQGPVSSGLALIGQQTALKALIGCHCHS